MRINTDPCVYCGHAAADHLPGDEWGPECPYPPKATKNPDDYVKAALVLAGFILASTGIAGLLYLILTAGSKAVL